MMDYFILKTTDGGFWCVNHISRGKSPTGEDTIQFVCSGVLNQLSIDRVIGIFPVTPFPGMVI